MSSSRPFPRQNGPQLGDRSHRERWSREADSLCEEGRLLWLLGQGLRYALQDDAKSTSEVIDLRSWVRQALAATAALQPSRATSSPSVERGARLPAGRSPHPPQRPMSTELSPPGAIPVVWVASQPVRGVWATVAIGADGEGRKHVLALQEGAVAEPSVAGRVLESLAERGVSPTDGLLLVTDGSRTLDEMAKKLWGGEVQVAHCHWCLQRDVLEHLPTEQGAGVAEKMTQAWLLPPDQGAVQLQSLVSALRKSSPGAAERLERGLEPSLIVGRLGVPLPLRRHLEIAGVVRMAILKALEWGDSSEPGAAALATGLPRWIHRTKRLIGHEALPVLVEALRQRALRP